MQSAMTICNNDSAKRRRVITTTDDDDATKQCRRIVSNDDGTDVSTWRNSGKPQPRRVRFSSNSSLILYHYHDRHEQDYDDEHYSSWHTREEERRFKQAARCQIELLRRSATASGVSTMNNYFGLDSSNDEMSPVGLERSLISDEYTLRRANSRRQVSRAVFREQARHGPPPLSDECIESIATHAQEASEWSRAQAQAIGYFQAIANHPQQLLKSEEKQED